MEILHDRSTVVLVGNWNPFILTPEWVGKHIFEGEKVVSEFFVGPKPVFRFSARGAKIVSTEDRMTVFADQVTKQNLQQIGRLAEKLHGVLPHTPIHALGVNHAFVERSAGDGLLRLFDFDDKENLPPDKPVERFEVHRRLASQECRINIRIGRDQNSSDVRFDFNFHYEKARDFSGGLGDILVGEIAWKHFEFARNLLTSSYHLEIEDEQMEDPNVSEN